MPTSTPARPPAASGSSAILPGPAAKPVDSIQLRASGSSIALRAARSAAVTGVIGIDPWLSRTRLEITDRSPRMAGGLRPSHDAATVRDPAAPTRIADGGLHHLYRQQELFLVVAPRLADAEADGRGIRGDVDPAARGDDARQYSASLALRTRAGAPSRRSRHLGFAGDRRVSRRDLPGGPALAGGYPGPRRRTLGLGRDAFGLRRASQSSADEYAFLLPPSRRDARGASRHQPRHRALARLPQALRRGRRIPVRAFHHRRCDVCARGEPLPYLQGRAGARDAALCGHGLGASLRPGMAHRSAQRANDHRRQRVLAPASWQSSVSSTRSWRCRRWAVRSSRPMDA